MIWKQVHKILIWNLISLTLRVIISSTSEQFWRCLLRRTSKTAILQFDFYSRWVDKVDSNRIWKASRWCDCTCSKSFSTFSVFWARTRWRVGMHHSSDHFLLMLSLRHLKALQSNHRYSVAFGEQFMMDAEVVNCGRETSKGQIILPAQFKITLLHLVYLNPVYWGVNCWHYILVWCSYCLEPHYTLVFVISWLWLCFHCRDIMVWSVFSSLQVKAMS